MKAGRELDRLVGEKVMNYDYDKFMREVGEHIHFYPSTNIADAWLVVEKLKNDIHWFGIDMFKDGYRCIFRVRNKPIDEDWVESFAPSAPLAICLAALKVVGAEVNE